MILIPTNFKSFLSNEKLQQNRTRYYFQVFYYFYTTTRPSRPTFVPRFEISMKGIRKDLITQLHMPTLRDPKIKSLLLVQKAQTDPIFAIEIPFLQPCHLLTRRIHLGEKGTLLRNNRLVLCKHVHGESTQFLHILLIGLILRLPLVINIGQKITILEIVVQILRIAIVLRGHQSTLRKRPPRIPLEDAAPRLTQPIRRGAVLELADAVVLAAKGHEILHSGRVAAFDIGAEELAALGEAEGVYGGGAGEDGVRG